MNKVRPVFTTFLQHRFPFLRKVLLFHFRNPDKNLALRQHRFFRVFPAKNGENDPII